MIPERLGPYRIEKLLGSGGMGAVYGGVNDSTGERAAIKVLAPQIAADPTFRARFEAEIETLKKLRHPNIVQLFGFGEQEGQLFYSMEWVSGCSLQERLKEEGPLPWREAVAIGVDVAMALKHAHDRGIIHRDLKPANLLWDDEGTVKLTDFGIAKLFGGSTLTAAGGVMGTADYMAPEQAAGKVLNHRVDLYSLGGVLYALLTGRPPFLGNSLVEVLDMLQHDKPTPISRLMPAIPRAIDAIVLHLLAKSPEKRVPTALAAANQLRSLLHALSAERTAEEPEAEFEITDSPTEVTPSTSDSGKATERDTALAVPPQEDQIVNSGTAATSISEALPYKANSVGSKSAEIASKPTAADSDLHESSDEPTASDRFTVVSPEQLGADESSQFEFDDDSLSWPLLTGIAVTIVSLALLGWYTLRPPSGDQLWQRAEPLVAEGDWQQMIDAEEPLSQLIERFPEHPRAEEARGHLRELDMLRLERKLRRRLDRSSSVVSLAPLEQLYFEAMTAAARDPRMAASQLESLVALYESQTGLNDTEQALMELANHRLVGLHELAEELEAEHTQLIAERLELAAELRESDPTAAAAIYSAIVQLYSEKPFAASQVKQARDSLADVEKSLAKPPVAPANSENQESSAG